MAASLFREESRTNGRVWRDRGASPGHAVNPSMEANPRHPWRVLSRQGHAPPPRQNFRRFH